VGLDAGQRIEMAQGCVNAQVDCVPQVVMIVSIDPA